MFITFEGPEGSGKSSLIPKLTKALIQAGYEVVQTREPGGTAIGDQIRDTLLNLKNEEMHPVTETLLFQASRAQHVNQIIKPALADGKVVLCDRYADSTMAYQGYGHQRDLETIAQLIAYATSNLKPDLTILLDLDVELGLKRRSGDSDNWNRLDAKELAFHKRVRQGYLQMLAYEPDRWVVVDASQPLDEVLQEVENIVLQKLEK
jgi:dTMP kinase